MEMGRKLKSKPWLSLRVTAEVEMCDLLEESKKWASIFPKDIAEVIAPAAEPWHSYSCAPPPIPQTHPDTHSLHVPRDSPLCGPCSSCLRLLVGVGLPGGSWGGEVDQAGGSAGGQGEQKIRAWRGRLKAQGFHVLIPASFRGLVLFD